MKNLITTKQLTKQYGHIKAVNQVDINIQQGDIYGLIGQNGSGKTTLIRMLTSLIRPTSGQIDFHQQQLKIGAVIEGPAYYPYLSARDNLMYYAKVYHLSDKQQRVQEVLEFIGLENTKNKKVKNFSLGMRQRLGLGIAILNRPDFLILDEPMNGLDPQGIVEMRQLIERLNQQYNTTVLISSHLLSELSLLATRYGIIHQGKLIKQLSEDDLNQHHSYIKLKSSNLTKTLALLEQQYQCEVAEDVIKVVAPETAMSEIAQQLMTHQIYLTYFTYEKESLEDYFLNLVGGVK